MNTNLEFSMKVTQSDIIDIMIENKLQEYEASFAEHNKAVDGLIKHYHSKKGKIKIKQTLKNLLKDRIKGLPGYKILGHTDIFHNMAHHHRSFLNEYLPSGIFPNSAVHLKLYYPVSRTMYNFDVTVAKQFTLNGVKYNTSAWISLNDEMKEELKEGLGLDKFVSSQEEILREYGEYIRFIKLGKRAKNRMMKQIIESTEDGKLAIKRFVSKELKSG